VVTEPGAGTPVALPPFRWKAKKRAPWELKKRSVLGLFEAHG